MAIYKATLILFSALAIITTSCKKKGCMDPLAKNYSAEAEKEDKKDACTYTIATPTSYIFEREGKSTVSFGGQTMRLEMLSEMVTYMKTTNTAGVSVNETTLFNMYANNSFSWVDANNLNLTSSTKQLKNKTAYATAGGSPDVGIQAVFQGYMSRLAIISGSTTTSVEDGEAGIAGIWPNDGVKGPYLMDADGKEYTQLIEKGLMCAVFMSQITVNYLGDITNDDNTTIIEETNYTEMEHHWDEAYGYFTDALEYPTNGTNRFWGKYSNSRENVMQTATKIGNAFRTGRAAIVGKDYSIRDTQVKIIRDELERVSAGTAIHYLNSAKSNIANNTTRNHALSEAYAFLEGLKYGYNAISGKGMTTTEITTALDFFGADFNTVTLENINNAIDAIASKTGLNSVKGTL